MKLLKSLQVWKLFRPMRDVEVAIILSTSIYSYHGDVVWIAKENPPGILSLQEGR